MVGAIASAVGGNLVGGLVDGLGGGKKGGLLDSIGEIATKLLDPIGLLGGKEKDGMSQEMKEMMHMMRDMIKELMSMVKQDGKGNAENGEGCEPGGSPSADSQPIDINSGSGDDSVQIGS